MFARGKFQIGLTVIVVVVAALASDFLDERVALAQGDDSDYVDVGLILDVPVTTNFARSVNITVANYGAKTAYDVVVVVNIVYPENSSYFPAVPNVPVGSALLENDEHSLRWTIPALGGLEYESVTVTVDAQGRGDKTLDPHEFFGEVSTSSFESDLRKGNNTDRAWVEVVSTSTKASQSAEGILNTYSIDSVSVDQQNPSPGDIVNFTVAASPRTNIDKKVTIKLTDGLTVDEDAGATPPRVISVQQLSPSLPAPAVSHSNGVFTIGTRKFSEQINQLSITLPVRVASDAVVNEQCLTATITGNPPPGPLNDDISDNVAKLCLGELTDKKVVFRSGSFNLWELVPCVGVTTTPCHDSDSVELIIKALTPFEHPEAPYTIFQPDDVVVQIQDPLGRSMFGSDLRWSIGHDTDNSATGAGILPGVLAKFERSLISAPPTSGNTPQSTNYSQLEASLTVEAPGEGSDKGNVIVSFATSFAIEFFDTTESPPKLSYGPNNFASYPAIFFRFTKLGTYVLHVTMGAQYDSDLTDIPNTGTLVKYTDTATYTFHVGPIAELGIIDGSASSHAAADRSALTIVAANNGPDDSLGARVTGLPMDAEVIYISQGNYDGSTGVWNVGELKIRDYYRSRGESDPTLVLSAADGETADVTIENSVAYTVCIGSDASTLSHTTEAACEEVTGASWHEGTVYDYKPGNNTAKITAVKGTGGGGGPDELRFAATPLLTWEAVPHVNHWPVHRYQVQYRNGDNWLDLADVAGDQTYFADSGARSKPSYRVRALNEAGVPGFWSRSAAQVAYRQALPPSSPLNVTAVAGHAGEVLVSWDLPVDDGGSPITYYQVQWSRSGTGGWSNACRSDGPSDLSCTQTGIPAGETRYYRVAAHTAQGTGVWSDLAVATTIPGVPSAPRGLSASRAPQDLSGETILAIRLTWNAPATDNGSAIYSYAVEYVDYDQSAGRCGTDWEYLGSDPSVHSNDPPTREFIDTGEYHWVGLEPGAHRCYRVSAINSAGEGPFSNVARASAGGEVPPEWVYLDGEADGQDAITLYWGEPYYDGGAPVTSYQLQYSEDDDNWRNLTSTSGSARSYTHTGLKVGDIRHYRIRARNSAGWSEWSDTVSVSIDEGATADISQPTLTVRATTSTEVLLSWNSLCNPNKEDDCENKGIDGYMVEYSEDGGLYGWEQLTWFWTDQTKVVDSTVAPGATRYYRVSGYQEVDRRKVFGRWSQAKTATTADFVVGAPQNFTITAEGERGLKLVWDEVTEGRDASSITGYRIERNTPGDDGGFFDTSWVARQTNRKSNTYVETGLTPGTDYYYRVAAVTRNGSVPYIGRYSDIESFFIPPTGG